MRKISILSHLGPHRYFGARASQIARSDLSSGSLRGIFLLNIRDDVAVTDPIVIFLVIRGTIKYIKECDNMRT